MKHILFVCHGNICRSPMAEFIMKKMARTAEVSEWFDIASAGTSDEEVGNPVYPMARQELAQHGIGCMGKKARQIELSDYDQYDMIVFMDSNDLNALRKFFITDPEEKITRLLDHTDNPHDIVDPWYTRDFRTAWNDIFAGVKAIFDKLLPQAKADLEAQKADA